MQSFMANDLAETVGVRARSQHRIAQVATTLMPPTLARELRRVVKPDDPLGGDMQEVTA